VSRFTEKMYRNARTVTTGMVTGEPHEPVRHTWGEVHEIVRAYAAGLSAGARDVAAAKALIHALAGPMAAPVLKSKGMEGPAS